MVIVMMRITSQNVTMMEVIAAWKELRIGIKLALTASASSQLAIGVMSMIKFVMITTISQSVFMTDLIAANH